MAKENLQRLEEGAATRPMDASFDKYLSEWLLTLGDAATVASNCTQMSCDLKDQSPGSWERP